MSDPDPAATSPPTDLEDGPGWYYLRADQTLGPVSGRSLQAWLESGFLSNSSLVWRDGMSDWAPISDIDLTSGAGGASRSRVAVSSTDEGEISRADALAGRRYASFARRLAAYVIDNLILACALLLALFPRMMSDVRDPEALSRDPVLLLSSLVLSFAYFVIWESSSWQATPGKRILRIRVTDLAGRRLSFFHASVRHLGKIASSLTFYLGFLMAAFTARRQALHDLLAGCVVLQDP